MESWLTALIAILVPASGGGLWATVRWVMTNRSERERSRQAHETAMAERFASMQTAFLESLREIQADANARIERHRNEHLEDVKLSAQRMAEAIQAVQAMQARTSGRPPTSNGSTNGTSERK